RELPAGVPTRDTVENIGTQGTNGFGKVGDGGPCPPHGPNHHYFFRLYALESALLIVDPLVLTLKSNRGRVHREYPMGRARSSRGLRPCLRRIIERHSDSRSRQDSQEG